MWRPLAAGLFCTYFTFVGLPLFFDFIDAPSKRPQTAAPVANIRPQTYGHVRPASRQLPLAALAAGEILPLRHTVSRLDTAKLVRAFDPDIYRGGRIAEPLSVDEVCEVVEEVAAEHNISAPLFARLIWQESRFRNETVSRAGAQGMAQFMPTTAAERGLDDPFDPLEALPASAQFLRQLTDREFRACRGGIQRRSAARERLARRPRPTAEGDARLRPPHHRARGGLLGEGATRKAATRVLSEAPL
jgi:hypothetical protein